MPAFFVSDCSRCNTKKITFYVAGGAPTYFDFGPQVDEVAELLCMCRECLKCSIYLVKPTLPDTVLPPEKIDWWNADFNLVPDYRIIGVVSPGNVFVINCPDSLPPQIKTAFTEGLKCLNIDCYNAAGTMFRLCLDFATKELLPNEGEPGAKIRRSLGLRMNWLFDNGKLPLAFQELAECVKDDGNDGAHEGILDKESALDLEDFTRELLIRLYTEPARLIEAKRRREARHAK